MLTSAQVIPLLSHEDPDIRRAARRYLTSAHDPAPATAEDFWAAADKEPPEESGPYLDRLGLVPQTEASLRRLLEELPKADPATRDSLRRTLERIEFDLLKQQWETIRTSEAIEDKVRAHLQARLDLASEPADPLWDRMMSFVNSIGDRDLTEAEELQADQLIEAVSRHPDIFRDRVLAAISDPNINGWPEMFVVDIAGEMKLAEATPALLEKLKSDKFDFLWELAGDALVHIGSEDVVRQIAERFPTEEIGFQISASDILGRIKRPESQKVLLDLLQGGDDPEIATSLTLAIVEQFPDDPATFEVLRKIAREESYDRSILHLDEDLLMLSKINGLELPEAEEWRKTIERNRAQWAMGTSNFDQVFQSPGGLGPATFNAAPMRPFRSGPGIRGAATAEQAPPRQRIKPFKKATPKVGRNDPCPCGSGKKFKKCCGK